jgi:CRP-like cAMP-binding protein
MPILDRAAISPLQPPVQQPERGSSALAHKLHHHAPLTRSERDALRKLLDRNIRTIAAGATIVEAGSPPNEISVIMSGWACRVKHGSCGRQIVAVHLPGDICDFNALITGAADTSVEAIDTVRVAGISRSGLRELSASYPRVSQGFWWDSLVSASVQREWIANICQRDAQRRIAHLICEIATRLDLVGLFEDNRCPFPLTQANLGNACGITTEHANRSLRHLKALELVSIIDRWLVVPDRSALAAFCDFDPAFLHVRDHSRQLAESARELPATTIDLHARV